MKRKVLDLAPVALVLALSVAPAVSAQQGSKQPTADIDTPPRTVTSLQLSRAPGVMDSTGIGGGDTGAGGAQRVQIPSPCELEPELCDPNPAPQTPPAPVVPPPPTQPEVSYDHCGMPVPNMYSESCSPAGSGWYCPGNGHGFEYVVCR